jgi:protein-S-isoprenylcysteine O-methyltransferase Ste14
MSADRAWKYGSLVATVVLVGAVLLLFHGHALFASGPVALAVQGAAIALMLWARWTFKWRSFHAAANPTAGGIVTGGPYRYWRHPIYAAILYFVWAGVASHAGPRAVATALVATIALGVRMAAEERLLAERYPEYLSYAARTRRIVPYLV